MSIATRLSNIEQTHQDYLTLVDIEHRASELASSNLNIEGYSQYQIQAAQTVAQILGIGQAAQQRGIDVIEEILYICAVTRPPATKWNNNNSRYYENWRDQQQQPNLAQCWVNKIQSMSNQKLEKLGSHLRLDDATNEVFVTAFKEGTVHRHEGKHGDLLDFSHA